MNSSHSANSRRIVCAAAAGVAAGVFAVPFLAPLALWSVGFGASGIVAGKFPSQADQLARQHLTQGPSGSGAAGIQDAIGNVAAGSAFAVVQSIAMGGAIPVGVTAVGASLGAGVGAAAGTNSDGEDPKEGDPKDKAGEDGTPVDANGGGPVDEGIRTGRNRS